MSKLFAWLGAATLALILQAPSAWANDPLKPYVVLIMDTSGSMNDPTNAGLPSCGGVDTKHNHARCAINRIVNSYGDMVFALGRFRMSMSGTTTAATFPSGCSTSQNECSTDDDRFELLSGLVDGNNQAAGAWVNLTGNTCTATGTDPEIWSVSNGTPLEGSLKGARRYWQGLQAVDNTVIWPSTSAGFDPINGDPLKNQFLPSGCDPNVGCTVNCCASQCRPYVVILLTDGDEFCGGTPANAAASLLNTPLGGKRYRIQTKPIGFGKPPGDAEIEAIAHAGGAPDLPGNEGYYASDEQGLQLAISSILRDAIKTEQCNDLDDDCDAAVDEDFPGKNGACDNGRQGVCRTTGQLVCRPDGTGLECNAPAGPPAGTEICNNLDDDCDGRVDEGVTGCACSPQGEQCDNDDDDCDGRIDEGLTRPCGTGTCQGTETCVAGQWTGCDADVPVAETCNGLDDNCDNIRDGFTEACSNMSDGFPPLDPRNNPGDPTRRTIPENICHPGLRTCPVTTGPPNSFGPCLGEQQPQLEICNGLDDNCNNVIDEGTGGADCSTNCGVGRTRCVNGVLECDAVPALDDDTCDGNDDDCDGKIDEDYMSPGSCGAGQVCEGELRCINGAEVCVGRPLSQESCNCEDDDCDGVVDDGALCGTMGQACTHCQCALPCETGEFPCAMGKVCSNGFCIEDVCATFPCPDVNGAKYVCRFQAVPPNTPDRPECVRKCDPSVTTCPFGQVCVDSIGECRPNNCTTFPEQCTSEQRCINGSCVSNPCAGVTCPGGQYCVGGQCVASCADMECPAGQRCRMGTCELDPCGKACPFGKACHDETGQCVDNGCQFVTCPQGQWCNPNNNSMCEDDPCEGTACPSADQRCLGGTCYDPADFLPDAGEEVRVTTGGGGGCSTGGGAGLGAALVLLLLRRRREVRS